jgi:MazG family protein
MPEEKDWLMEAVRVMARLRAPDGCAWDREQTHESLKQYLLEESAELFDALEDGDDRAIADELGDVFLQVLFHAQIASEQGRFDMQDVARGLCEKLVRRHPHVFGEAEAETAARVLEQWDQIKQGERADRGEVPKSALHGVPRHLPALHRAYKIQKKAAKVGFDWPTSEGVYAKIAEELAEVREASESGSPEDVAEEIGDLLFAVTNLSRFLGHFPEEALHATVRKFERRFTRIEDWLSEAGREPGACSLEDLDSLWERAKAEERGRGGVDEGSAR